MVAPPSYEPARGAAIFLFFYRLNSLELFREAHGVSFEFLFIFLNNCIIYCFLSLKSIKLKLP